MLCCQGCGHQLHDSALSCPSCGTPNRTGRLPCGTDGYFGRNGRISRTVYWLQYIVPIYAVSFLAAIVDAAANAGGVLSGSVGLVLLVPQLASCVRRLHDRNRSGWCVLLGLIPVVGWSWLFIEAGFVRGTHGRNRFGPDPLAEQDCPFAGNVAWR